MALGERVKGGRENTARGWNEKTAIAARPGKSATFQIHLHTSLYAICAARCRGQIWEAGAAAERGGKLEPARNCGTRCGFAGRVRRAMRRLVELRLKVARSPSEFKQGQRLLVFKSKSKDRGKLSFIRSSAMTSKRTKWETQQLKGKKPEQTKYETDY